MRTPSSSHEARRHRPRDPRALVAVDLGAESCRVSLLRWTGTGPTVQLVHRFANGPVSAADGSLRWPLQRILQGVDQGVARCAELAKEGIASLAVDGWAVDFVRLEEDDSVVVDPFCYRDPRNAEAASELHKHISAARMRAITGVEQQPLNTVYQLYADVLRGRPQVPWLNLPEYMLYRWGGERVAERTNAAHTQLVDLKTGDWSAEIATAAGLDLRCAPRIVPAGTVLGRLTGPLASLPGLGDAVLIAPACHDTASAVAGIADLDETSAYISCGTWSLVGALVPAPLNSAAVREDNFTNLAAVGGKTCFHKGVNGLWLLKKCMDHWADEGDPWSLQELLAAAEREPAPESLLDTSDVNLMGMDDMPARINAQRSARGLRRLEEHSASAPQWVSLLLHSLAERYQEVLDRLRVHSGREIKRVVMVGGGAQNAMLRRLTATRTGLEVVAGPAESATLGNLAVQLAVLEGACPDDAEGFGQEVRFWASVLASGQGPQLIA